MRILDRLAAAPSFLLASALLVSGCPLSVDLPGDGNAAGGDPTGGDTSSSTGGGASGGGGSFHGVPCHYLHGEATLTSYTAPENYVSSAYSFELASQNEALTKNDWDVLYEGDTFVVSDRRWRRLTTGVSGRNISGSEPFGTITVRRMPSRSCA